MVQSYSKETFDKTVTRIGTAMETASTVEFSVAFTAMLASDSATTCELGLQCFDNMEHSWKGMAKTLNNSPAGVVLPGSFLLHNFLALFALFLVFVPL